MSQCRSSLAVCCAATLLLAIPAEAASLQQVSNWNGGVSLPSDVTMWAYVPDKVVTNPPILTLIHYCGGTASAVFGQAQGGGVVKAADQYGFIIVAPSSGRCWDVQSNKTFTRDGGGDSHAVAQMVRFAITKYQANAERVYATGDSSGGMMTELLLGLYPDIFKGGSSMAGIPCGCRSASETGSGGGYSGACAGGNVSHTPQEWGDIVRKMNPTYTGHRARVQLFHGDADTTIRYANHTEAIKEWTDVLGLDANPTTTDTGVQLGKHQAKRQRWQNSCGQVVLDAFTSIGGDHGPSDALFLSQYLIPFLGLDKTGPVDPEVAACSGDAGVSGTGGQGGDGGAMGAGGSRDGGPGGSGTGGAGGRGGVSGSGGASTGIVGDGGSRGRGGAAGSGGGQAMGGRSGGSSGSGGSSAAGGAADSGGTPGSGGVAGAGGAGSGGSAGNGSGGVPGAGGAGGSAGGNGSSMGSDTAASGCTCALGGTAVRPGAFAATLAVALGLALFVFARRRRR
jgi:acetylxylan esterase